MSSEIYPDLVSGPPCEVYSSTIFSINSSASWISCPSYYLRASKLLLSSFYSLDLSYSALLTLSTLVFDLSWSWRLIYWRSEIYFLSNCIVFGMIFWWTRISLLIPTPHWIGLITSFDKTRDQVLYPPNSRAKTVSSGPRRYSYSVQF